MNETTKRIIEIYDELPNDAQDLLLELLAILLRRQETSTESQDPKS